MTDGGTRSSLHLDLDGAWPPELFGLARLDLRELGPRLRYFCRATDIAAFAAALAPHEQPFVLFGSGDFHHLTAALVDRPAVRKVADLAIVSFDNHPDWDMRPPKWACGGWVNRALELDQVKAVAVWGCGNFELALPHRIFRNREALKSGRLRVFGWAERQTPYVAKRFNCVSRSDWEQTFEIFARSLAGRSIYITVDSDCLTAETAATNWENGLFTPDEIGWAIRELRANGNVVAGDYCGAFSEPVYSRRFQRFAGRWDHPKLSAIDPSTRLTMNQTALSVIWPPLVGG